MNPQLREKLGIAAYQAAMSIKGNGPGVEWSELSDHTKENYYIVSEAVAQELAQITLPALQSLAFAFTGKKVDMSFEE